MTTGVLRDEKMIRLIRTNPRKTATATRVNMGGLLDHLVVDLVFPALLDEAIGPEGLDEGDVQEEQDSQEERYDGDVVRDTEDGPQILHGTPPEGWRILPLGARKRQGDYTTIDVKQEFQIVGWAGRASTPPSFPGFSLTQRGSSHTLQ